MVDSEISTLMWSKMLRQGIENTLEFRAVDLSLTPGARVDQFHAQQDLLRASRRRQYSGTPAHDPQGQVAVFLDIDGVISPLPGKDHYSQLPLHTFVQPMVPVTLAVLDWLQTPRPERLVWSSSWGPSSLELTEDLGAGPVDTAVTDQLRDKGLAVATYLTEHPEIRAAVVCDDDPYTVPTDVPLYYIHPDPQRGLTPSQLAEIDTTTAQYMG